MADGRDTPADGGPPPAEGEDEVDEGAGEDGAEEDAEPETSGPISCPRIGPMSIALLIAREVRAAMLEVFMAEGLVLVLCAAVAEGLSWLQ